MHFTESSVMASRADLQRQIRDASLGAEVREIGRLHRADFRKLRHKHA